MSRRKAAAECFSSTSAKVKKLPRLLLIFSPSTSSMPVCIQVLAKPSCQAQVAWAHSFS
ncbi:Uncharacterised protein [Collinsella intestinalis]|nr:Uncharacterised protein [Collinsella intestinalis]